MPCAINAFLKVCVVLKCTACIWVLVILDICHFTSRDMGTIFFTSRDKEYCVQLSRILLSTYDFPTLYTTLPHNLIKEKTNTHLTERAHFIWLVMIKNPFLLLNNKNDINCGQIR